MAVTSLLISGLPGKMAQEVLSLALESNDFNPLPFVLTSDSLIDQMIDEGDESFQCFGPKNRNSLSIKSDWIAVDYTTPDSALDNIKWYCSQNIPFVCGTTGFDSEKARDLVSKSKTCAVIAPNMAMPIVMLQAAMKYLTRKFPGALKGYDFSLTESHQSNKKDTSGTAKALMTGFQDLGVDFTIDDIKKIRDPEVQRNEVGVPKEFIEGHAYHTYKLSGANGTIDINLEHNVRGRRIYAEGTLNAVSFLKRKIQSGEKGKVFDLMDVLKDSSR